MLAGRAELGLLGHRVDLLAHLAEGRIDALALGLDVVGDGMLDDDSRLVEHRFPARHSGDQLEAAEPERSRAAQAAAAGAVDQPGGGDHLRQHHRDGLKRLDLDLFVTARLGVLDGKHADRAFEANDRNAGKAVEALLAGFGPIGEGRVIGGFGEVEDAAFGGDRADQALAHAEPGHVDRFLAQAVGREQLELVVAQKVDGADLALHRLGDQVDDLVELGLRAAAARHDLMQARQDFAGGGGGAQRHGQALSDARRPCHAGADARRE